MNSSETLKKLISLFQNQKYNEVINEIDKIKNKDSVILNLYGGAKLLRNDKTKNDKVSALESFEKGYLIDITSENGLRALCNFINIATEFKKFDKIFEYYHKAKKVFGENEKLLEAIQRVYQYQFKVEERNKILKKLVNNKSKSVRIWSSFLYNNNFLSDIVSQEDHYNLTLNFDGVLKDFKLPEIKLENKILERPIRIGFLSADLNRNHSVVYFLRGLLENLDKKKFHLTAIGNWRDEGFLNKQISNLFDDWFSIYKYDDLNSIKLIRSKKLDVIFDLMGMTSENRPVLFKNRISPVQINWLGYCNTSGIKNMDYIFSDYNLIYEEEEKYYFEKVKKFKNIWNCHSGFSFNRNLIPQPSLKNNIFTFGSFNNFTKISKENLNCWEKILKTSNNSRLILKSSIDYFPEYLSDQFKKRGIFDQIKLLTKTSTFKEHIDMYDQIDLALDTFPYTGVTTTFEALWKSVPVLTLKGYNFKSRCGYSIIKNIGIDYLIAEDVDEYVSKAVYLSKNFDYLENLRKDMFAKIKDSKLFDVKNFAEEFQNLIVECIKEKYN